MFEYRTAVTPAKKTTKRSHHRSSTAFISLALALGFSCGTAATVPAVNAAPKDVLIASFFTSAADKTDTIYRSTDGKHFDAIATAYADATPNDPTSQISTLSPRDSTLNDPSIMYHDGYFWMLSGWNQHDGKFWPMIGISKDGRTWTHPEGSIFNGHKYPGITMSPAPANGNDTVAPEWFKDNNGDVYILFSAGLYGEFHGNPQHDKMRPYLVKVEELSATQPNKKNPRVPKINFRPGTARALEFSEDSTMDRIDGSIFQEGRNYYLVIKRDGRYNEIWKSQNINNPRGWKRINANATKGFEGPTMTKFNGKYFLYADKLADYPAGTTDRSTGTFVFTAPSPQGPWSKGERIITRAKNGRHMDNRHGTVIKVTDPSAKSVLNRL